MRDDAIAKNVLLIVADDLGFNEHNFMNNGSKALITPNLDRLAAEGVVLKHYYVQPICSPTRSALMTGRYPIRLGTQANVIYWDTPWAISDQRRLFRRIWRKRMIRHLWKVASWNVSQRVDTVGSRFPQNGGVLTGLWFALDA